jgi:HipA-like protein
MNAKEEYLRSVEARKAAIYQNGILAGYLIEENQDHFIFQYEDDYLNHADLPAIGLSFPKTRKEFHSDKMFPFFSNMVAEGTNLAIQTHHLNIDENDILSLLAATASTDSIGAITVRKIQKEIL